MQAKHVELVTAIAEAGSLGAAALRLNKSQPALSKALQAAERDLGCQIFHRGPHGVVPTVEGERVVDRCRLIARGSRTPSGSIPYYYNPALMSPIAAGIGGGLGGLIAGAIAEGQQRRANRRNCLLIDGWRVVEVSKENAARVGAMTDADRDAYFNGIVGAQTVDGTITERIAHTLTQKIMMRSDYLIDIHAGDANESLRPSYSAYYADAGSEAANATPFYPLSYLLLL